MFRVGCCFVGVCWATTPGSPANIMDLRGSDSSIISIMMGGMFMSIEDFPESSSQAM